jgi:hypothetical protein
MPRELRPISEIVQFYDLNSALAQTERHERPLAQRKLANVTPAERRTLDVPLRESRAQKVAKLVLNEVGRANRKHPPMNSHHEGYAVLLEEVDELWDEVKADSHDLAIAEAVQVAAMAIRFIVDNGHWGTLEVPPFSGHTDPTTEPVLLSKDGGLIQLF